MAIGTGHGASITFGTTAFTGAITSIGGNTNAIEDIEDFDLSTTTRKTFRPSDLFDPGEFTVTFFVDSEDAYPAPGAAETITITYKQQPTEATSPANLSGTGYIKSVTTTQHATGEMMTGELVVKWDGKTGPTFTVAT